MTVLERNNDTSFLNGVTADGSLLAFYTVRNGGDVWTVSLRGDRALAPLTSVPASHQDHAGVSPDGKWVAYRSNESGRYEIYRQPFPLTAAQYQVTTTGAHSPLWSPDGKELFYVDVARGIGRLTIVNVRLQPGFAASQPVAPPIEASLPEALRRYDIMPDGKRFVVVIPSADSKSDRGGALPAGFENQSKLTKGSTAVRWSAYRSGMPRVAVNQSAAAARFLTRKRNCEIVTGLLLSPQRLDGLLKTAEPREVST